MVRNDIDGVRGFRFEAMTAAEIMRRFVIARATRMRDGRLTGFQRQPVMDHVRQIAAALRTTAGRHAAFENPLVLGTITGGMAPSVDGTVPDGYVIDGQQRLLACEQAGYDGALPAIVWEFADEPAMAEAFVRVNNCRPLPKALVAEILPGISRLPARLTDGTLVALIVEALNYRDGSSLQGLVRQQTNPSGIITDTALARGLRRSMTHGALHACAKSADLALTHGVATVDAYFGAVRKVFARDWEGHTPRTSRLLHATGTEAMLHLMDVIAADAPDGHADQDDFRRGLTLVAPHCRWTAGTWAFSCGATMPHDGLQNVPSHVSMLCAHLSDALLGATRHRRAA